MKKTLSTMGALLILSTVLAACNTDEKEPTSTAANEPQQEEQVENEVNQDTTTEENNTTGQPEEDSNVQEENKGQTLTYTSNGNAFTENLITSTSEELGYTIAHFENYTLEAEDPGIDHLFYNGDDTLSMQIEVASKEDTTFEDMKASIVETISVIAPDGKYTELDLTARTTDRADIQHIVGYETLVESEKVVKIVFERENMFVTLTIYDTTEADLTDAFLQMGLTIQ